jgi:DnaJ family protein A protein 5
VEEEALFSESELSDEERYECVVCTKVFKSENQYETHEKSKKHIKAIQLLKREMQKENKNLNTDVEIFNSGDATLQSDLRQSNSDTHTEVVQASPSLEGSPIEHSDSNHNVAGVFAREDHENGSNLIREFEAGVWHISSEDILTMDDEIDDEYASREQVERRLSSLAITNVTPKQTTDYPIHDEMLMPNSDAIASDSNGEPHQTGKAKAKRAKKAARHGKAIHSDQGVRNIMVLSPHQWYGILILMLVQMCKM